MKTQNSHSRQDILMLIEAGIDKDDPILGPVIEVVSNSRGYHGAKAGAKWGAKHINGTRMLVSTGEVVSKACACLGLEGTSLAPYTTESHALSRDIISAKASAAEGRWGEAARLYSYALTKKTPYSYSLTQKMKMPNLSGTPGPEDRHAEEILKRLRNIAETGLSETLDKAKDPSYRAETVKTAAVLHVLETVKNYPNGGQAGEETAKAQKKSDLQQLWIKHQGDDLEAALGEIMNEALEVMLKEIQDGPDPDCELAEITAFIGKDEIQAEPGETWSGGITRAFIDKAAANATALVCALTLLADELMASEKQYAVDTEYVTSGNSPGAVSAGSLEMVGTWFQSPKPLTVVPEAVAALMVGVWGKPGQSAEIDGNDERLLDLACSLYTPGKGEISTPEAAVLCAKNIMAKEQSPTNDAATAKEDVKAPRTSPKTSAKGTVREAKQS